jgi:N6-adenosine-specific RNA methylase IME4
MGIDEIKSLDINGISGDRCWLFLWTTQKYLYVAKDVLEGWGFRHLLTMVWEKTYGRSSGMPLYGFRWNAEFVLVGVNFKAPLWPEMKLIPAVFQAPNVRHSEKPDLFYDMVCKLGKHKIDLFARKLRDGWDSWGDEIPSAISHTFRTYTHYDKYKRNN